VFKTPLGRDLLSIEIRDATKSSRHPDGHPVQRFPIKRFIDILPVVKARLDAVTDDDIRTRAGLQDLIELRRDKEFTFAYCALDLANEAGLVPGPFVPTSEIKDPPSGLALDVVSRILSFAEGTLLDIHTVRRRFPVEKPDGKCWTNFDRAFPKRVTRLSRS
jgi:hypothetical protein